MFDNRNIVITGGSRGLGAALGQVLAQAGARVVLVARGADALTQTVARIRADGGVAHGIVADLGDKRAPYRIAGEAAALVGNIDVLINNASELGETPLRLLLDTECEDLERVLQVNLVGPFRLTKIFAGAMALRGEGLVVDISSDAAVDAYPRWGAYGASKAALDHLTRIWAAELEGTGVRFVAIDPGEMRTAMHAAAVPDADPESLADPLDVAQRIVDMMRHPERAPSGARLSVPSWQVAP